MDLRTAVARYALLDAATLRRLEATATQRSLQRGDHLLREGDIARHLFLVERGILRYYYLADGQEHTGQFFFPGAFFSDVASFWRQQPALQNVDALQASVVTLIARDALLALYDEEPAVERFGRRLVEEALAYSQLRTASLLRDSAEARYRALVRQRPHVVETIPLYIVASYLGVTPEALSRIRRRIHASG